MRHLDILNEVPKEDQIRTSLCTLESLALVDLALSTRACAGLLKLPCTRSLNLGSGSLTQQPVRRRQISSTFRHTGKLAHCLPVENCRELNAFELTSFGSFGTDPAPRFPGTSLWNVFPAPPKALAKQSQQAVLQTVSFAGRNNREAPSTGRFSKLYAAKTVKRLSRLSCLQLNEPLASPCLCTDTLPSIASSTASEATARLHAQSSVEKFVRKHLRCHLRCHLRRSSKMSFCA